MISIRFLAGFPDLRAPNETICPPAYATGSREALGPPPPCSESHERFQIRNDSSLVGESVSGRPPSDRGGVGTGGSRGGPNLRFGWSYECEDRQGRWHFLGPARG